LVERLKDITKGNLSRPEWREVDIPDQVWEFERELSVPLKELYEKAHESGAFDSNDRFLSNMERDVPFEEIGVVNLKGKLIPVAGLNPDEVRVALDNKALRYASLDEFYCFITACKEHLKPRIRVVCLEGIPGGGSGYGKSSGYASLNIGRQGGAARKNEGPVARSLTCYSYASLRHDIRLHVLAIVK
jgi:hypothetical protein